MANTGFPDLRIVGLDQLEAPAWRTAIHAESIIEGGAVLSLARGGPGRPGARSRLDGARPARFSAGPPRRGHRPDRRIPGDGPGGARLRQRADRPDAGRDRPGQRPLPHPPGGASALLQPRRGRDADPPRRRLPRRAPAGAPPGPAPRPRRAGRGRTAASATCSTASASCTTPTGPSSQRRSRTSSSAWP
ncbi:MAG: hypothetical protein MZV63_63210 [Marinilabiliales bacterium]|nr:hypothetical protein [Marinilabiliales bacterium]